MPAVGAAIAAALATKVGMFVATTALSLALGAYQSSQAKKKARAAERAQRDAYNASLKDRHVTIRSGVSTRKYALGVVRVGGTLMHIESNGHHNTALDSVLAMVCNKCELVGYYVGDEYLTPQDFPGEKWGKRKHVEQQTSRQVPAGTGTLTVDLAQEIVPGSVMALPSGIGYGPMPTDTRVDGSTVEVDYSGEFAGVIVITYKTYGAEKMRVMYKDGDPDQTASGWGDVDTPLWTEEHRLRGVAYLRTLNLWDEDLYHAGSPQMGAVLRGGWVDGHRFFDPRTNTYPTTTTNPALLAAWWMTLPRARGGMGIPESWIDWPYVSAAANVCDEQIRVRKLDGEGYEYIKRYECNTLLDTANPPADNLNIIMSSMAGDYVFTAGLYRIFAGAFRPATITITDDDVVGDKDIVMDKSGQDDAPANIVTSTFVNAARNWLESSPRPIRNDIYIAEDGAESPLDLSLPATTDERQGAYLMGVALESARPAFAGELSVLGIGEDIAVLDTVQLNLTNRPEYVGRTFQVINRVDNWDGTFKLTLQEVRANIWQLDPDTFLPTDPTPIPDLSYLWNVSPVTNFQVDPQQPQALADGTAVVRVDMAWDLHPQPYVRQGGRIETRYRAPGGEWIWIPPVAGDATGTSVTTALVDGVTYQFQARAVSGTGATSNWSDGWTDYDGVIEPPPALTGLFAAGVFRGIDLSWTFPAARNALRQTEVRYSANSSFLDAVPLGQYAWPTNRTMLLELSYSAQLWFWARLVDENGTPGPWYPSEAEPGVYGAPDQDPDSLLEYLQDDIASRESFERLTGDVEDIAIHIARFDADLGQTDGFIRELRDKGRALESEVQSNAAAMVEYYQAISSELDDRTNVINQELLDLGAENAALQSHINSLQSTVNDLINTPEYDPLETYLAGTLVVWDDHLYQATQDVPSGNPPPDETYWHELGNYTSLSEAVGDLSAQLVQLQGLVADQIVVITSLTQRTGNVESSLTTVQQVQNGQAQAITSLQTTTGQITSRLNTIQNVTDQLVEDIGTLQIASGNQLSAINNLQRVTEDLAVWFTSLTMEQGANASSIKRLFELSDRQAAAYLRLGVRVDEVEAAYESIQIVNGELVSDMESLTLWAGGVDSSIINMQLIQAGHTGQISQLQTNLTTIDGAVQTAQNAADTAQQAADDAAQAAAEAAGIAGGKADVLFQSATPATKYRNANTLWVDTTANANTPKRWNGSAWVAATDKAAIDAAAAAATAQSTANTARQEAQQAASDAQAAQQAASTAQQAADQAAQDALAAAGLAGSKGKVIIQSAAPATADRLPQNLWIDTTGGANTPKRWSGSAWVAVTDKAATDAANAAVAAQQAAAAAQQTANEALGQAQTARAEIIEERSIRQNQDDLLALALLEMSVERGADSAALKQLKQVSDREILRVTRMALRVDGIEASYESIQRVTDELVSDYESLSIWAGGVDTSIINIQGVQQGQASQIGQMQVAIGAASGAAEAAQQAADAAQQAADQAAQDAAAAAGIAGGKADVLFQSSTPAASYRTPNTLWIDTTGNANTPKRWIGGAWTVVTDRAATDAANAAANAQGTANTARQEAQAAQQTANAAQQAASTAQQAADQAAQDALAAAGLAGSKGKVIIQASTPATADRLPQNLWIDTTGGANTPKRWSGSAWVAVTDKAATDAANAAANAHAAAQAAQQAADAAGQQAQQALVEIDMERTVRANGDDLLALAHLQLSVEQGAMESFVRETLAATRNQARQLNMLGVRTGNLQSQVVDIQEIINDDFQTMAQSIQQLQSTVSILDGEMDGVVGDLFDLDGRVVTAQQAANNAAQAAATAQQAADEAAQDALAAAGLAGSKGKVIIQASAPAVVDRQAQNLWIDTTGGANTPKRWNGTSWAAVTDKAATDAAAAAANAQSAAAAAQNTANTAQSTANTARSEAQAAQTAAQTAQQAADDAAQEALVAAGLAGSKGKVIIQASAPAVADRLPQNLWIDTTSGANTPKRWSGSAWVAVTDKAATDAANAAANAQGTANTARQEAQAAQQSANQVSATVQTMGETLADLDGNAKAAYGFKLEAIGPGGKRVATGLQAGAAVGADGSIQSEMLFMANYFAFLAKANGTVHMPFVIDTINDTVLMKAAYIEDLHGNKILANTLDANRLTAASFLAKLAEIDTAYIKHNNVENSAIRTAHIQDLNVGTIKLANHAVSVTAVAFAPDQYFPSNSWVDLPLSFTLSHTATVIFTAVISGGEWDYTVVNPPGFYQMYDNISVPGEVWAIGYSGAVVTPKLGGGPNDYKLSALPNIVQYVYQDLSPGTRTVNFRRQVRPSGYIPACTFTATILYK